MSENKTAANEEAAVPASLAASERSSAIAASTFARFLWDDVSGGKAMAVI